MHALPAHLHALAQLAARRDQLEAIARIELLVARILTTVRRADIAMSVTAGFHDRADRLVLDFGSDPLQLIPQPSMAWFDGPRSQPRSGNGRFLSKAWLADAELYLPADRAWFRHPVSAEGK